MQWHENASELYSRYRTESQGEVKTRLQALWLLRTGNREVEVAHTLGVAERTIRRWVSWYRSGGLDAVCRYNRGKAGRSAKLNPEQQSRVHQHVQEYPSKTAEEIRMWVEKQWNITYHPKAWYVTMKQMGLRKKVPRPRSDKASDEVQQPWKKRPKQVSANGERKRSRTRVCQ